MNRCIGRFSMRDANVLASVTKTFSEHGNVIAMFSVDKLNLREMTDITISRFNEGDIDIIFSKLCLWCTPEVYNFLKTVNNNNPEFSRVESTINEGTQLKFLGRPIAICDEISGNYFGLFEEW